MTGVADRSGPSPRADESVQSPRAGESVQPPADGPGAAPGTALDRAVAMMDRLRSPGGCPWDAAQTHTSLARYLIEETYEVLEAIETGDAVLLREELGDLLLQVLFHARIAQEAADGFGIDDVANDLVDKLERRHPHVFAAPGPDGSGPADLAGLDDAWERDKAQEKGRTSAVDGIPVAQPALALTAKLVSRARRAGVDLVATDALTAPAGRARAAAGDAGPARPDGSAVDDDEIGRRLLAVVGEAVRAGIDPETALRRTARAYRAAVVAAEIAT